MDELAAHLADVGGEAGGEALHVTLDREDEHRAAVDRRDPLLVGRPTIEHAENHPPGTVVVLYFINTSIS